MRSKTAHHEPPVSAALTATGLACERGGRLLFTGFDLALGAGSAAIVRGPNGIGKSSLLRVLAGLLTPFAGSVERSGRLALADEALALDRDRPLAEALGFWTAIDGVDRSAIPGALTTMGIAQLGEVPARLMSTGQRKRAVLARVIASDAAIWLLDEPANGLDDDGRARLETAIADHRSRGGIVLVATHQPIDVPDARPVALVVPAQP